MTALVLKIQNEYSCLLMLCCGFFPVKEQKPEAADLDDWEAMLSDGEEKGAFVFPFGTFAQACLNERMNE